MKKILLIFLICIFSLPSFAQTKIDVLKVYDGDSILAKIDENIFRIRLIGIDCFEGTTGKRAQYQAKRYNLSENEVVRLGNIAGETLREELKNKNITFEFRGIDKYHRALGVLYADGVNINEKMLKNSYCKPFKR